MSLKDWLPSELRRFIRMKVLGKGEDTSFVRPFYSQCGEDIILEQLISLGIIPQKGFFIDVGAYHPFAGSNTFKLYKRGWQGINIDPNPTCAPLFKKFRARDTNLSIGISKEPGAMVYYIIKDDSSMNTFSRENLVALDMLKQVTKTMEIETVRLSEIINNYVPKGENIDFLNIDAEGYEMEVLGSMDWDGKHPKLIALEQNNAFGLEDILASNSNLFLKGMGYTAFAKNIIAQNISTVFYIKSSV